MRMKIQNYLVGVIVATIGWLDQADADNGVKSAAVAAIGMFDDNTVSNGQPKRKRAKRDKKTARPLPVKPPVSPPVSPILGVGGNVCDKSSSCWQYNGQEKDCTDLGQGCYWYPHLPSYGKVRDGFCSDCAGVNCGTHFFFGTHTAPDCSRCPQYDRVDYGQSFCKGECKWYVFDDSEPHDDYFERHDDSFESGECRKN